MIKKLTLAILAALPAGLACAAQSDDTHTIALNSVTIATHQSLPLHQSNAAEPVAGLVLVQFPGPVSALLGRHRCGDSRPRSVIR